MNVDPLKPLPPAFLSRMQSLLGEEFLAFLQSMAETARSGLRVNTLKLTPEDYQRLSPFPLTPIPWCPTGFLIPPLARPGRHPHHAAGLYYLQEPSAMAAAEILDPQPGERVLDLSAAPGGKTTHLAALMRNRGWLVANEIHPGRVWDLAENLERCGVRIATITNETPERLAAYFGATFDRVLVDAPCSGEGMFRKAEVAQGQWSPDLVRGCAIRQQAILPLAAQLVRPGGWLVYCTCTFSPEENEQVIAHFLREHPNFILQPIGRNQGFSPARQIWVGEGAQTPLDHAVRIWPHLSVGEGHFIARLQCLDQPSAPQGHSPRAGELAGPPPILRRQFQQFLDQAIKVFSAGQNLSLHGSYLYQMADGLPDLGHVKVIHPGWWLGVFKKDRFEPSHALAMGITADQAGRTHDLSTTPAAGLAYLHGESLPSEGEDGWTLTTLDGFPLGWGKRVHGQLKNLYPHGLRWK